MGKCCGCVCGSVSLKKIQAKSAVCPENIDVVRELIKTDRHVTYREIPWSLGVTAII